MQKAANKNRKTPKEYSSESLMIRSVIGILLIALGVLSVISVVGGLQGSAFSLIKQVTQGLGGGLCLGIPVFLIWGGVLVALSARQGVPLRAFLLLLAFYLCLLGIVTLCGRVGDTAFVQYVINDNLQQTPPIVSAEGFTAVMSRTYDFCRYNSFFGGMLGMLTAWPLWTYTTPVFGIILLGVLSLCCLLFFSKFDVIGTVRRLKAKSDEALEQRELDKQEALYRKQLEEQQQMQQARQSSLFRPAYERRGDAASAQGSVPDPNGGFAQGLPVMPLPNGGYAQQQSMFGIAPQNQPVLYDEMIVPETPSDAEKPAWKFENPFSKERRKLKPKDRELQRTNERLEEIRRRKEEINQALGENGESPAASSPDITHAIEAAKQAEMNRKLGKKGGARRPSIFQPTADEAVYEASAAAPEIRSEGELQPVPFEQAAFAPAQPSTVPAQAAVPYVPQAPTQPAAATSPNPYVTPVASSVRELPVPSEAMVQAQLNATQSNDRYGAYKKPAPAAVPEPLMSGKRLDTPDLKLPEKAAQPSEQSPVKPSRPYPYPMIELLNLKRQTPPDTREQDRANATKLEKTLESFGIPARVQRVTHGPAVTRFELGLVSSGINVKRITSIADNIALDLAANGGVRIEVPIPGTNLFGVEVPNKEILSVTMAEVLTSPEMQNAKSPLAVALGKDITGKPVICDLAKMPHLLIAGQTGSGKSVCINSIINSLLYRTTPEEVRMIMIDPKVVELQGYNVVPHLLIPVVSDPHKASGALAWAVQEMLDRYHKMQSKHVRDLTAYNAKLEPNEPKIPRIVIIIDELADLMLACKKEVEESIIRIAQLARAAGIHMVVATQRPTVNVITGLIKANIPSRIAFAVASSIDSRTILDMNGAEKLLGRGDMFYYPTGAPAPIRVQGCFLSDSEISNVVDYIGMNSETDYDESINEVMDSDEGGEPDSGDASSEESGDADDRLQEAVEMVLTDGQASISMLQRRMKIGYARAGRLIDDMATRGIVSKSAGSKPREILMTYDQYLQMKDSLLK